MCIMSFAIRPFTADDAAWLISQHAEHYAIVEGFDASFGPLVASIVDDFLQNHDPAREMGWLAHDGDKRLGTIFCVALNDDTAKLRLFYLIPDARGTGAGQALLDQCLSFARGASYQKLTLWTHESHVAAGRIYKRNGFTRVASKPVRSFGVDLVEETWEISL